MSSSAPQLAIIADIHLGLAEAPGLAHACDLLRRSRERGARALIIAGDLLDRAVCTSYALDEANRLLALSVELFETVDFIAGNHDVHHQIAWPEEVVVHGTQVHSFARAGIALHTAAVAADPDPRELVSQFPVRDPGDETAHVGILHTSVDGRFSRKPCLPTSVAELSSRGYDSWVLGHVHGGQVLRADPFIGWVGMGRALLVDAAGRPAALLH